MSRPDFTFLCICQGAGYHAQSGLPRSVHGQRQPTQRLLETIRRPGGADVTNDAHGIGPPTAWESLALRVSKRSGPSGPVSPV